MNVFPSRKQQKATRSDKLLEKERADFVSCGRFTIFVPDCGQKSGVAYAPRPSKITE
jgi:2,4-dienoyl-CoA reductase-like NADH-dependent reductase (Old Yellow Enzyme family)